MHLIREQDNGVQQTRACHRQPGVRKRPTDPACAEQRVSCGRHRLGYLRDQGGRRCAAAGDRSCTSRRRRSGGVWRRRHGGRSGRRVTRQRNAARGASRGHNQCDRSLDGHPRRAGRGRPVLLSGPKAHVRVDGHAAIGPWLLLRRRRHGHSGRCRRNGRSGSRKIAWATAGLCRVGDQSHGPCS